MFCGKCGAQNLENATFCKECGAPLNSTWRVSPLHSCSGGFAHDEGFMKVRWL